MHDSQYMMKKLLDRWSYERNYGENMTWDGIFDDYYWETSPRILCLLKDTYDDFVNIAPTVNGYGPGGVSKFWENLQSWVSVIEQRWRGNLPTREFIEQRIGEPLKSIGYINIKKFQGESSVNWDDVITYARNDKQFLIEQIELVNPQVILCCGYNEKEGSVFEIFTKIIMAGKYLEPKFLSYAIFQFGPWLVIDWWHPARPSTKHIPKNWENLDLCLATEEVQEYIQLLRNS